MREHQLLLLVASLNFADFSETRIKLTLSIQYVCYNILYQRHLSFRVNDDTKLTELVYRNNFLR